MVNLEQYGNIFWPYRLWYGSVTSAVTCFCTFNCTLWHMKYSHTHSHTHICFIGMCLLSLICYRWFSFLVLATKVYSRLHFKHHVDSQFRSWCCVLNTINFCLSHCLLVWRSHSIFQTSVYEMLIFDWQGGHWDSGMKTQLNVRVTCPS